MVLSLYNKTEWWSTSSSTINGKQNVLISTSYCFLNFYSLPVSSQTEDCDDDGDDGNDGDDDDEDDDHNNKINKSLTLQLLR